MISLGLQRISGLLATTALPWRAIHVAGTNGKGSVCAYVSGMLDAYNRSEWRAFRKHRPLRHARFTSPHLADRWDCVTVDQRVVAEGVFREVEGRVLERDRREAVRATEFEVLTATAFEVFTREEVDVAVVEVGMGGRLDATNVIGQMDGLSIPDDVHPQSFRPSPLVTAISSIGLDHQAFLGNTLEEIAREKAGIIKPRVPVVRAPNDNAVNAVIAEVAQTNRSPLYSTTADDGAPPAPRSLLSLLDYLEAHHSPSTLPSHTRHNARTAFITTCLALQQLGRLPIDPAQILQPSIRSPVPPAIEMFQVPWHTACPGRQQQLNLHALTRRHEPVLLDGAHNAQSARALHHEIARLDYRNNNTPVTWVVAASSSKDAAEILRPLLRAGDVVFTVEFGPVDGMPWVQAQRSDVLKEACQAVVESLAVHACGGDVRAALQAACEAAGKGPLVVAGSLYLVGDVLRLVRGG